RTGAGHLREGTAIHVSDVTAGEHPGRSRAAECCSAGKCSTNRKSRRKLLCEIYLQRTQREPEIGSIENTGSESNSTQCYHSAPSRSTLVERYVPVDVQSMLSTRELSVAVHDSMSWRLEGWRDSLDQPRIEVCD